MAWGSGFTATRSSWRGSTWHTAAKVSCRLWDSHMASKTFVLAFATTIALTAISLDAQQPQRRFYPDDPMWVDDDKRDIAPVAEDELSKSYDFAINTFKRSKVTSPALNVNTLGEVPDSSWFTNRLGVRDMSLA